MLAVEDRCPYIQRKLAGDETYDICELNGTQCILIGLYECEIWKEIKEND